MADKTPRAAGLPLAIAIILGAIVGAIYGQPTIGLLVGTGVGAIGAIAVWLSDRRRIGR
jgi:uncharacterized membrane protein